MAVAAPAAPPSAAANDTAIVALLVNTRDSSIKLPPFYLTAADQTAKSNVQDVRLGAACDRAIVGANQPEVSLTRHAFDTLKGNPIVKALATRGDLTFRGATLIGVEF